jgi:hypothetical protein
MGRRLLRATSPDARIAIFVPSPGMAVPVQCPRPDHLGAVRAEGEWRPGRSTMAPAEGGAHPMPQRLPAMEDVPFSA